MTEHGSDESSNTRRLGAFLRVPCPTESVHQAGPFHSGYELARRCLILYGISFETLKRPLYDNQSISIQQRAYAHVPVECALHASVGACGRCLSLVLGQIAFVAGICQGFKVSREGGGGGGVSRLEEGPPAPLLEPTPHLDHFWDLQQLMLTYATRNTDALVHATLFLGLQLMLTYKAPPPPPPPPPPTATLESWREYPVRLTVLKLQ